MGYRSQLASMFAFHSRLSFKNIKVIDGLDKRSEQRTCWEGTTKEMVSPLNVSADDTHINHCD